MNAQKEKLKYRTGCPSCPSSEDFLSLDTVLYNGFGGYCVYKNDEVFYQGHSDEKWEKYWTLEKIEKIAREGWKAKWQVVLDNPLRGATWTRIGNNQWALTETNLGFA